MKKALAFLLLAALLATPLVGCDKGDDKDEPAKTTTDNNANNIPEYNAADANPASDFEYKVGEDDEIIITKYVGTDPDVVIPEKIDGKDVKVIGQRSFKENQTVVSVLIPDAVWLIDEAAFVYCKNLTTVRLSRGLEVINVSAFDSCKKLSNIQLPASLTHIGERAFAMCESLKQITIPASCYRNDAKEYYISMFYAFAYSGLETVVIEEGVQFIPSFAFCETNIKEIVIPASVEKIPSDAFDGAVQLKKVFFEGNAPANHTESFCKKADHTFTIYYHEGAEGFTSPEWNGYKTEIW